MAIIEVDWQPPSRRHHDVVGDHTGHQRAGRLGLPVLDCSIEQRQRLVAGAPQNEPGGHVLGGEAEQVFVGPGPMAALEQAETRDRKT